MNPVTIGFLVHPSGLVPKWAIILYLFFCVLNASTLTIPNKLIGLDSISEIYFGEAEVFYSRIIWFATNRE